MIARVPSRLIATTNVAPIGCLGIGGCAVGFDTKPEVSKEE
jgi:hypothetical protein